MTIPDALLTILVCPKCREQVKHESQQDMLICDACALSFPIRDGIPVMLVEEAEPCSSGQ